MSDWTFQEPLYSSRFFRRRLLYARPLPADNPDAGIDRHAAVAGTRTVPRLFWLKFIFQAVNKRARAKNNGRHRSADGIQRRMSRT
jgi:hypothetical protein